VVRMALTHATPPSPQAEHAIAPAPPGARPSAGFGLRRLQLRVLGFRSAVDPPKAIK
jgi:hypothetical protein